LSLFSGKGEDGTPPCLECYTELTLLHPTTHPTLLSKYVVSIDCTLRVLSHICGNTFIYPSVHMW